MNQALLDRVIRSPRLPSLPTIALEVIELVQQKDVNIKQIAHTISHDPALAGKILKTVNSSYYGQAQPITTISHALVVLGLSSVKTVALGFSLVSNLKDHSPHGFDHLAFWKRSLYAAAGARTLARELHILQHEEAFLAGLLQDLGLLAMAQTLGGGYCGMVAGAGSEHRALRALERQAIGTDHAEVGAAMARHWRLPPMLVASIEFHEDPDAAPADLSDVVHSVALGARIADVFISQSPGNALEAYYQGAQSWFGMAREQAEPLLTQTHAHTLEMQRLFDLPTGVMDNAEDILGRANEALLQISLQQQAQSSRLEEENQKLSVQASTDSLTGVANRRRFNEYVAEQFAAAAVSGAPLSILFLDADHFKKFNDTYGHQIGDLVLAELAAILKAHAPPRGLAARYGGEEFAMVLPGVDRVAASRLAEQVRRAVEAAAIRDESGRALHITTSIGVASEPGGVFQRAEHLVKAADQGVYAAKAAGRNCVRVFTPRPRAASAA